MRLVVDAQALQSRGSRHRGIGRYSFALLKQMALQNRDHQIIILLSGIYADTIEPIRESLHGLISSENIRVWRPPSPCGQLESNEPGLRQAGEVIREQVIASLEPDAVLVLSLFEGLDESVITSVKRHSSGYPVAVVLYDLIPYIYKDIYLENKNVLAWYENKLDELRRADICLSISASTKNDAIKHMNLKEINIVNISGAASEIFSSTKGKKYEDTQINNRFKILRSFIMYTGGSDHRKNIDGLVHAFADLRSEVRKSHQLLIVCRIDNEYYNKIKKIMIEKYIADDEIIFAGVVSDSELVYLYRTCKLFVFPSLYEGFGLPALEAMQCGAPVIASETSSMPEIIGDKDAMFDPTSSQAITRAIETVLENEDLRLRLAAQGWARSQEFTWAKSAEIAWGALTRLVSQHPRVPSVIVSTYRPRLAYVSPLPPMRSGIAGYSADILPELSRYYDIDLVVDQDSVTGPWIAGNNRIRSADWLRQNRHQVDRVLYQFGNSVFHIYMFDLLRDIPGTSVLHDFGFGGLRGHLERSGEQPGVWSRALEHSHGWQTLLERHHGDLDSISMQMPVNLDVIQQSNGLIVHSKYAQQLSKKWFDEEVFKKFTVVPFPCRTLNLKEAKEARVSLGWLPEEMIICCFGFVAAPKLNHAILAAWLGSSFLPTVSRLVFVGEAKYDYGIAFLEKISNSGLSHRITVTGWTDDTVYYDHLSGADFAIQLRGDSRGESSAAVFECFAAGLPVITNAQGSFGEIPAEAVVRLAESVSVVDLRAAMERLARDPVERRRVGEAGRHLIATAHNPAVTARAYRDAIEHFHIQAQKGAGGVLSDLRRLPDFRGSSEERDELARAIATSFPVVVPQRRVWLDVALLESSSLAAQLDLLRHLMLGTPQNWKIEPIEQCSQLGWKRATHLIEMALQVPQVAAQVPEPNSRDFVIIDPSVSPNLCQQLCEGGAQLKVWRGPDAILSLWS